jgi:predicted branched-subunit amino acid permease
MRIIFRKVKSPFYRLKYIIPTIFFLSLLITAAIIAFVWNVFQTMDFWVQVIFGAGLLLLAFLIFLVLQAIFAVLFAKILIGLHMRKLRDREKRIEEASKRKYA